MIDRPTADWTLARRRMVENQIRARGIADEHVLDAMRTVLRELFVPLNVRSESCEDRALPIGFGQTISQPYIVAYMTEQLRVTPECRVLEVGTGSGYQTAVLGRLARRVESIERIEALRTFAVSQLETCGCLNVSVHAGDGSLGLPELSPFDRIMVTAAAPNVPEPLIHQLAVGGRLIAPIGGSSEQSIMVVDRTPSGTVATRLIDCRFVKLVGSWGWPPDSSTPPPPETD